MKNLLMTESSDHKSDCFVKGYRYYWEGVKVRILSDGYQHHRATLWRYCDTGDVYECYDVFTYLFITNIPFWFRYVTLHGNC